MLNFVQVQTKEFISWQFGTEQSIKSVNIMYRQKSEIIGQIQLYHKQVAKMYYDLYEKAEDKDVRSLVYDLFKLEKERESYLVKHERIAKAINCWLDFPCERLSNQISDCLNNTFVTGSEMKMGDIIRIQMFFDDCLIKIYSILASENALTQTEANTFYYMLKKTKKEKSLFANMLCNSNMNLHLKASA